MNTLANLSGFLAILIALYMLLTDDGQPRFPRGKK